MASRKGDEAVHLEDADGLSAKTSLLSRLILSPEQAWKVFSMSWSLEKSEERSMEKSNMLSENKPAKSLIVKHDIANP